VIGPSTRGLHLFLEVAHFMSRRCCRRPVRELVAMVYRISITQLPTAYLIS